MAKGNFRVKTRAAKQPKNKKAEHLERHRWQPGQSGNPKGRPAGQTLTPLIRSEAEKKIPEKLARALKLDPDVKTWRQAMVRALFLQFINGNQTAVREVLERLDGKVAQGHELGGVVGGEPIKITVVYE